MKLLAQSQAKTARSNRIADLLMQLTGVFGLKQREIALAVGVSGTYLNGVINGRNVAGRQLLAGLELLKELTIYRAKEAEQNRILAMKAEIAALEARQGGGVYPAHVPDAAALNETPTPDPRSKTPDPRPQSASSRGARGRRAGKSRNLVDFLKSGPGPSKASGAK